MEIFTFRRPCSKISDIKHKTTHKEAKTFLNEAFIFKLHASEVIYSEKLLDKLARQRMAKPFASQFL